MDTKLFFENFDLLAQAPGGVPKLRELILQLAVRGKLVEQNENDSTVQNAITELREIKSSFGALRKGKKKTEFLAPEKKTIPLNWEWVPFGDLVRVINGRAYKKKELLDSGTPVLRVGNLFTSNQWYYSDLDLEPDKYIDTGDLIYAWSASFGPFIWQNGKVIYHYHIWKLEAYSEEYLDKNYLYYFLEAETERIKQSGSGIAMIHMTKERMELLPTPLPPLEEQKRVVAKVDELMARCDELEERQNEVKSCRVALNKSALDSLTSSTSPSDFKKSWKRVRDSYDFLYDTPETIADLRQSILQLAVTGKLSPTSDSVWKESVLGEVLAYGPKNGYSPKPVDFETDVRALTLSATTSGKFDASKFKYIDEEIPDDSPFWVNRGDVLVQRGNSIEYVGISAIYCGDDRKFIFPDLMMKLVFSEDILPEFGVMIINSPSSRVYVQSNATGTSGSMPKINQTVLKALPFFYPSLEEQHEIIQRYESLMDLCDQLELQLSESQSKSTDLLNSIVEQLLVA